MFVVLPAFCENTGLKFGESGIKMKLQTVIVGLPNVGKSTLFNVLTESKGAVAAYYPFCTIEPHVGVVEVLIRSLLSLMKSMKVRRWFRQLRICWCRRSRKRTFWGRRPWDSISFTIRQCDAIVHVVRCFVDDNVVHVDDLVDPVRDAELINLNLHCLI